MTLPLFYLELTLSNTWCGLSKRLLHHNFLKLSSYEISVKLTDLHGTSIPLVLFFYIKCLRGSSADAMYSKLAFSEFHDFT